MDGLRWYWVAPEKSLGNVSGAYGETLVFELPQTRLWGQYGQIDVSLRGAGMVLVLAIPVLKGG